MSLPDPAAGAVLEEDVVNPIFFVYLDFLGDPMYANSSAKDITPTGTGIPELDGNTFDGLSYKFIDVSPIRVAQGGSDTVTVKISGLPGLDSESLNLLGDPANWQGRPAMVWRVIRDRDNVQHGGFQHYYTGYMTSCVINGSAQEQQITVAIETYLAAFAEAPGSTYLIQEMFDPGDLSASAGVQIANGVSSTKANGAGIMGALALLVLKRNGIEVDRK